MQMYHVSFQVHYADIIDVGKVLVCATSNDHAAEIVRFHFELPLSQTTFEVVRVKPSIHQLDRREIHKHQAAKSLSKYDDELGNYVMGVTAGVRAVSEQAALRKLGQDLIDRSSSRKAVANKSVTEMEITCDRREYRPRSPAVEKQAIYKSPRFFSGGAARGR